MTEEMTKPIDQKETDRNALSELDAYLPGVVDSFYNKMASDPALQEKAREIAKGGDRKYTLYLLLNSDGPGFKEHVADIFKNTSWGAKNDTVVMESIESVMHKRDQAKAAEEQEKNQFRVNTVDKLLNKAA